MHDMMGMAVFFDAMSKQKRDRHDCRNRSNRRPARRPFRTLWRVLTTALGRLAGRWRTRKSPAG